MFDTKDSARKSGYAIGAMVVQQLADNVSLLQTGAASVDQKELALACGVLTYVLKGLSRFLAILG